jgi:hypothetical protein
LISNRRSRFKEAASAPKTENVATAWTVSFWLGAKAGRRMRSRVNVNFHPVTVGRRVEMVGLQPFDVRPESRLQL